jgi:hypothetical protein
MTTWRPITRLSLIWREPLWQLQRLIREADAKVRELKARWRR